MCPDFAYNTRLALDTLHQKGYQRIGLAQSHTHQQFSDSLIQSQFEWWSREKGSPKEAIPVFSYESDLDKQPPRGFLRWLQSTRPDCIIGIDSRFPEWLTSVSEQHSEPVDVAHLNLASDVDGWNGIDQQLHQVGAQAISMLSGILEGNFRSRCNTTTLTIRGKWVEAPRSE